MALQTSSSKESFPDVLFDKAQNFELGILDYFQWNKQWFWKLRVEEKYW